MDKTLLEVDTGTFRTYDYEAEYKASHNAEERMAIIKKFINDFCEANGIAQPLGFEEALENQLATYGADSLKATNPFLKWITNFSDYNGKDSVKNISNDAYNNLISLYGASIIVEKDLRGTGPRKTATPIFVADFFTKNLNEMTYIAQVFFWLEINANLEKTMKAFENALAPEGAIKRGNSNNATEMSQYLGQKLGVKEIGKVGHTIFNKPEEFVYWILFVEGKFSFKGHFRDVRNIENFLSALNNYDYSEKKTTSANDYDNIEIRNEERWKNLDKLSDREIREMIAYIVQNRKNFRL